MRVSESTEELRQICQLSHPSILGNMTWLDRNFSRRISIYFTRVFLEIGISANQVTLLGLIVGVIGGVFLTFPSPYFWFVGIALLVLCYILDHTDGEVARYNKSASIEGELCDRVGDWSVGVIKLICPSFGIYRTLHSIFPLIFGFLGVVSYATIIFIPLFSYRALHEKGLLPEALATYKDKDTMLENASIVRRFFQSILGLLFLILLGSIVDCFISPFTIGSVPFNARYICFIVYNLAWLEFAIERVYRLIHGGIKLF